MLKVLKKRRNWPWLAFKSETYLAGLKISKIIPGQLSKALGAATRNLFSNRSKGIELAAF
jgi:hypothetical protein